MVNKKLFIVIVSFSTKDLFIIRTYFTYLMNKIRTSNPLYF